MKGTNIVMKIKRLIEEGGICYRILNWFLYKTGVISHKVYSLNWDNYCMKKLKKELWNALPKELPQLERKVGNKVWFCWLQGIKNAPPLVNACYKRACKVLADTYEVVLIDSDNYSRYAKLPEWIISAWKEGKIGNAHFSDLLRMQLLIEHGGVWIDSTAYLTNQIPLYIKESDLFVFRTNLFVYAYPLESKEDGVVGNNWFIVAKSNDPYLILMRDKLFEYWANNKRREHYYIWHLMFSVITQKYGEYWRKVPIGCDVATNYFVECLGEPYSELKWRNMKAISFIHKLSWKIDISHMENEETFYRLLVDELLE